MQLARKNNFDTTQEVDGVFSLNTCTTPSLVGTPRRDLCFLKHGALSSDDQKVRVLLFRLFKYLRNSRFGVQRFLCTYIFIFSLQPLFGFDL